jgi:hypothetical protein
MEPVKDLKEAVVALCAITTFGIEAVSKKQFDFQKALAIAPKLQMAVEGYQNIGPQALDLDSAEGMEIVAAVAAELALENEKAKNIVIAVLESLPANIKLVKAIIG